MKILEVKTIIKKALIHRTKLIIKIHKSFIINPRNNCLMKTKIFSRFTKPIKQNKYTINISKVNRKINIKIPYKRKHH